MTNVYFTNMNYLHSLAIILFSTIVFNASAQKNGFNKEVYNSNKQSEDEIGYAQAVKVGNTIYISGSVGWGNMPDAIKLAYDEIEKTLKHYNATFNNVVKENIYTTALDSLIQYKDLRKVYYGKDYPSASWVEVKRLYNADLIIEVEIIAVLPE